MEHFVRFERGHNCRDFRCINDNAKCRLGSGSFHGLHGLQIRFIAKGNRGAVQFLLYTDWYPVPGTPIKWGGEFGAIPVDLGYHSKTPLYETQGVMQASCEYCDGEPCYYDGSSLNATEAMKALVNGGENELWKFLDAYYESVFNGAPFPKPAEYPKPARET